MTRRTSPEFAHTESEQVANDPSLPALPALPALAESATSSRRIVGGSLPSDPPPAEASIAGGDAALAASGFSLGPNHAVASWHDVLLSYFPRDVTIAALAAVDAAHRQLSTRHPGGTVTLGVVASGIAIPRPDVRAYAARIARESSATIRGECIVIGGHPFWVGMARSTLRTIELLSASWHPRQVFGDLAPAADWTLERSTRYREESSSLVTSVEALMTGWRAAYGAQTEPPPRP